MWLMATTSTTLPTFATFRTRELSKPFERSTNTVRLPCAFRERHASRLHVILTPPYPDDCCRLLTLFRCATGEDWNGLMRDAMARAQSGECNAKEGNCDAALPFFVSYELIAKFIILKMSIALINEGYSKAMKRDLHSLGVDDAHQFRLAWSRFDEGATGKMHVRNLQALVESLPPPLGLDPTRYGNLGKVHSSDVTRYVFQMNVPTHKGNVHADSPEPEVYVNFTEVLACLVKDIDGTSATVEWDTESEKPRQHRQSKTWEQVLPKPGTPGARQWMERLHGSLEMTDSVRNHAANSVMSRYWLGKVNERRKARKIIQEARKTLRIEFQTAATQTEAGDADTSLRPAPKELL